MSKLSVVINTYNEANILPRALNSIKGLADEIVIVDMESTDDVANVATKFIAKIFTHKHLDYVEPARNFGISKASGDWVLILDPDEEITNSLKEKIKELVKQDDFSYFKIPRKNIVFGKWLKNSRWWPDYNVRLFKKGTVIWNEVIHIPPTTQGVGGEIDSKEELAILHHHYDSIDQYIERMNRYTTQQAKAKVVEGYKFKWQDLIGKPVNEFLSRYFFGAGYKDGIHGVAVSLLQAFSELVVYLKIWQLENFKETNIELKDLVNEIKSKEKDLHYWQNDALYKETGSISARIKRKLRV